jgi:hypothetical protein
VSAGAAGALDRESGMRLWSLHPRHLDARGLVALWREGLLARAVLHGRTRGYRHHPQVERFRARRAVLAAIDCYLSRVLDEARERGYRFDASKIRYRRCRRGHARVTGGQLAHEWKHLLAKLAVRDRPRWRAARGREPEPHGCFRVVEGGVAPWERTGRGITPARARARPSPPTMKGRPGVRVQTNPTRLWRR